MLLLLLHTAATLLMTGLIWLVQIVHYPLMGAIPQGELQAYAQQHTRRITPVVAPLMGVELVSALALALGPPAGMSTAALGGNLTLLAVTWVSTAFLQVPRHRALVERGEPADVHGLVRGNWVRTSAWTARSLVLLWQVYALSAAAA